MRVDGEGRGVDAEKLASRLRLSPEFAQKVADQIAPGTTVIVTDAPAVRKPVLDSTYFANNSPSICEHICACSATRSS
jgi:hypothetical protein